MKRIKDLTAKRVIAALKNYGLVSLGSLILAIGYAVFIVPHNIVPGGVFGLSIVINKLTNLPVGMVALTINLPLLFWGSKVLGLRTGIKTALAMVMISVFLDTISSILGNQIVVDDILVSSVFGGILIAVAIVLVMKGGATTGGNDILVRIISKQIKLPYSQLILIINGVVVLMGVIVFRDFTLATYCIIAIFSTSKMLEYLLKKAGQNKTLLVFSDKNQAIENEFLTRENDLKNSVQLIHQDSEKKMILITKNNRKLGYIEQVIYKIDDQAKVIALESSVGLGI